MKCYISLVQAPLTAVYSSLEYNFHSCAILSNKSVTLVQNLGLTYLGGQKGGVKDAYSMFSAKIICA